MIRSFLIGLVAGMRSLSPLAAVSRAAHKGELPDAPAFLANPLVAAGATALAAGELWSDKLKAAPDSIAAPGMAVRLASGALVGAAVAPKGRAVAGGVVGAVAATAVANLSFHLRKAAERRFGQKPTGLVEGALVLGATAWIVRDACKSLST